MAPPLRNNRANNRANRVQTEHDIMEGLPVRQWRKQATTVSAAPPKDPYAALDPADPRAQELEMPRGSELYPAWCQALLRAARRGTVKPPAPRPAGAAGGADDDKDGIAAGGAEPDDAAAAAAAAAADDEGGFVGTKWIQVPKDLERPEPEYLAKRRRGLPSLYGGGGATNGAAAADAPPMRKTKVRRVDAEGRASVYEVLAPEGVAVEGEVPADAPNGSDAAPAAAVAPGTVVEGLGVANAEGVVVAAAAEPAAQTPPRRRPPPPPPKRRNKGVGRGRRKKVVIESAGRPEGVPVEPTTAATTDGGLPDGGSLATPGFGALGASGASVKEESVTRDGEDASEDEDEDGDEGDDMDREDGEVGDAPTTEGTPSRPPALPATDSKSPLAGTLPVPSPEEPISRGASSSPDVPLAASQAFSPGLQPNPSVHQAPAPPALPVEADRVLPLEAVDQSVDMETELDVPGAGDIAAADALQSLPAPPVLEHSGVPIANVDAMMTVIEPSVTLSPPEQLMDKASPSFVESSVKEVSIGEVGALSMSMAPEGPKESAELSRPAAAPLVSAIISEPGAGGSEELSLRGPLEQPPSLASAGEGPALTPPPTVQTPSEVEPKADTKAVLPAGHNPLDGFTAPKQPAETEHVKNANVSANEKHETIAVPEGEEDLFGSLEAHLNKGAEKKA